MCGIVGLINFDEQQSIKTEDLKTMADTIRHRGPDDDGYYIHKNVGLGFRRLSIIDLKAGHQPLANEDESIWIVFNGEIYNYKELREYLLKRGHVFRTNSDTETIVHLYEQFGTECVQKLRGMFSFMLFDRNKNILFGARDRFGIKPFYYYHSEDKFIFGSEIKPLLTISDIDKSIDYEGLNYYFTFGYISNNLSIYKNIHKLRPSEQIVVDLSSRKVLISKYWEMEYHLDKKLKGNELLDYVDEQLSNAVNSHMVSDVPVGAFLSGGIDSSSIVALMSKYSSSPVKTFTIGFREEKYNELKYARIIAQKYHTEHHEYIVEPESVEILPLLIGSVDEPFADNSIVPTYFVSKFAREHVKVVLSGDGGDELFIGYGSYPKMNLINKLNFPSTHLNKYFWGTINSLMPTYFHGKGYSYFLSQNKSHLGAYSSSIWMKTERKHLYNDNFTDKIEGSYPESYKISIASKSQANNFVSRMQEIDMRTYMVDDILTKVDRVSMLNSLEVRVPLLDHIFVQHILNIPFKYKFQDNKKKYILKEAMKKYLPAEIFNRGKQGFDIPLSVWFKKELNEYLCDTIINRNAHIYDYVNYEYVQKIIKYEQYGMRNFGQRIWSLLVLEEWLKQYKGHL